MEAIGLWDLVADQAQPILDIMVTDGRIGRRKAQVAQGLAQFLGVVRLALLAQAGGQGLALVRVLDRQDVGRFGRDVECLLGCAGLVGQLQRIGEMGVIAAFGGDDVHPLARRPGRGDMAFASRLGRIALLPERLLDLPGVVLDRLDEPPVAFALPSGDVGQVLAADDRHPIDLLAFGPQDHERPLDVVHARNIFFLDLRLVDEIDMAAFQHLDLGAIDLGFVLDHGAVLLVVTSDPANRGGRIRRPVPRSENRKGYGLVPGTIGASTELI